jgi:hypothetical protein
LLNSRISSKTLYPGETSRSVNPMAEKMHLNEEFQNFYKLYDETEDITEKLRLTREVYNPLINKKRFLEMLE